MNRRLAFVPAAILAAVANADISTSLAPVPNGLGPNSVTYDMVVHVTSADHWTSSSIKAGVSGANFYQDPVGWNGTPNPMFFPLFPALQWDTFVTSPESWPNTVGQGSSFALSGTFSMSTTAIDGVGTTRPRTAATGTG